jgi:hypothetical protein
MHPYRPDQSKSTPNPVGGMVVPGFTASKSRPIVAPRTRWSAWLSPADASVELEGCRRCRSSEHPARVPGKASKRRIAVRFRRPAFTIGIVGLEPGASSVITPVSADSRTAPGERARDRIPVRPSANSKRIVLLFGQAMPRTTGKNDIPDFIGRRPSFASERSVSQAPPNRPWIQGVAHGRNGHDTSRHARLAEVQSLDSP